MIFSISDASSAIQAAVAGNVEELALPAITDPTTDKAWESRSSKGSGAAPRIPKPGQAKTASVINSANIDSSSRGPEFDFQLDDIAFNDFANEESDAVHFRETGNVSNSPTNIVDTPFRSIAFGMDPFVLDPHQDTLTDIENSGRVPLTQHQSPVDEATDVLCKLHAYIFQNFKYVTDEELASAFQAPSTFRRLDNSTEYLDVVGKIMYASDQLIDTLTWCGRTGKLPPEASNDSPAAERENETGDEDRIRSSKSSNGKRPKPASAPGIGFRNDPAENSLTPESEPLTLRKLSDAQPLHLAALRIPGKSFGNTMASNLDESSTARSRQPKPSLISAPNNTIILSLPLKMSMMVCYIGLLSIVRSTLNKAFELLQCSFPLEKQASQEKTSFLPGQSTEIPADAEQDSQSAKTDNVAQVQVKIRFDNSALLAFKLQLEALSHT